VEAHPPLALGVQPHPDAAKSPPLLLLVVVSMHCMIFEIMHFPSGIFFHTTMSGTFDTVKIFIFTRVLKTK
jgi:hypothetical protein